MPKPIITYSAYEPPGLFQSELHKVKNTFISNVVWHSPSTKVRLPLLSSIFLQREYPTAFNIYLSIGFPRKIALVVRYIIGVVIARTKSGANSFGI